MVSDSRSMNSMKTPSQSPIDDSINGLSTDVARERLKLEGHNELPEKKRRILVVHILDILKEPMTSLLAICGVIYLFLGDVQDTIMLFSFLVLIAFITVYQERKTEKAVDALKKLSSPRALVIRDGAQVRISGRDVVREDILMLSEGDKVAADARILSASNVLVDESLLTGESFPVDKKNEQTLYAGTTVVRGQALAQVYAIGSHTEMGKVGRALDVARTEPTELQSETRRLVKFLAIAAGILCVFTAVVYSLYVQDWIKGSLVGLTLAMAVLPNELPAVLAVFLALGAWRLSTRHILTRRIPAVENLGATTVLCVDKTGTLTENKMKVQALFSFAEGVKDLTSDRLTDKEQEVLLWAARACQARPFDPMEVAIRRAAELAQEIFLVPEKSYALSGETLAVTQVWQDSRTHQRVVASKGAPETMIRLCHLDQQQTHQVLQQVEVLAKRGLRVLGVARVEQAPSILPLNQQDFDFKFLGLIGLADPLRLGVPESIRQCVQAGIRVIMITGDHKATAENIAREAGLTHPKNVLTGSEISAMSDEVLMEKLREVHCFARTFPEHKMRIVECLKKMNEVVVMTGDGVNDAPALRTAQIGIAMGGRGTDVAREASSIVLLDDDFNSIVAGIRLGRGIFDNLRSAMAYLLAVHIPIVGMSIFPVLFKSPLVLLPAHIAFLHLIIEPACSLVFEAEVPSSQVMKRPPRRKGESLYSKDLIFISLLQGLMVFAVVLAVYLISLQRGQGELDARALTFTTFIFANLALIFINRSWSRTFTEDVQSSNRAQWWTFAGALAILFSVLYIPVLRDLFRFSTLHWIDIVIAFAASWAGLVWFEIWKYFKVRKMKREVVNRV